MHDINVLSIHLHVVWVNFAVFSITSLFCVLLCVFTVHVSVTLSLSCLCAFLLCRNVQWNILVNVVFTLYSYPQLYMWYFNLLHTTDQLRLSGNIRILFTQQHFQLFALLNSAPGDRNAVTCTPHVELLQFCGQEWNFHITLVSLSIRINYNIQNYM